MEYEKKLSGEIPNLMLAAASNKPSGERKRRIFSYLFFPLIEPANYASE